MAKNMKQIRVHDEDYRAVSALADSWGIRQADVIRYVMKEVFGDISEQLSEAQNEILPESPFEDIDEGKTLSVA